MFTGIIQHVGKIAKVIKKGSSLQLTLKADSLGITSTKGGQVKAGDSIAINGVCLTVTSKSGQKNEYFTFDVVPETVKRTTLGKLKAGNRVNIESAIRAGEAFGGHFVQGHIDTTGIISSIKKQGEEYLMQIRCPAKIIESIIEKGSVAVDGVSLTVVNAQSDHFSVALIPFTLTHTILGEKKIGDGVNIELDIIGKWAKRLFSPYRRPSYSDEGF
jgi:riboflavin synthase